MSSFGPSPVLAPQTERKAVRPSWVSILQIPPHLEEWRDTLPSPGNLIAYMEADLLSLNFRTVVTLSLLGCLTSKTAVS